MGMTRYQTIRQRHKLLQRHRLWSRLRINARIDQLIFREQSSDAITQHFAPLRKCFLYDLLQFCLIASQWCNRFTEENFQISEALRKAKAAGLREAAWMAKNFVDGSTAPVPEFDLCQKIYLTINVHADALDPPT